MTPKSDNELRTIVYVDSESYLWLGAEFFDGNGQTEAAFPATAPVALRRISLRFGRGVLCPS
jgi:hypothetical protein